MTRLQARPQVEVAEEVPCFADRPDLVHRADRVGRPGHPHADGVGAELPATTAEAVDHPPHPSVHAERPPGRVGGAEGFGGGDDGRAAPVGEPDPPGVPGGEVRHEVSDAEPGLADRHRLEQRQADQQSAAAPQEGVGVPEIDLRHDPDLVWRAGAGLRGQLPHQLPQPRSLIGVQGRTGRPIVPLPQRPPQPAAQRVDQAAGPAEHDQDEHHETDGRDPSRGQRP